MAAAALPPGVQEVQRIAAPGGGFYVLGSDGGVFAIPDASGKTPAFYGSVPGLKGDTLAGQHGNFAQGGLSLNPGGGYTETDANGHQYGFDTSYARGQGYNVPDQANTLPSDPAYLAWANASGLGLQSAAGVVGQNTAAINAALATSQGDLNTTYDRNQNAIGGRMEARGIGRSGEDLDALNENERQRGIAIGNAQTSAANKIAGLNQTLASQVAAQQADAASRGLSTAQTQDYNGRITDLQQKYPAAFTATGTSTTSNGA